MGFYSGDEIKAFLLSLDEKIIQNCSCLLSNFLMVVLHSEPAEL